MSKRRLIFFSLAILFFAATNFVVYYIANHRAESSLKMLVESQSEGKLLFQVDQVKLNLLRLQFDLIEPELRTKDTTTTVTGYHVKAKKISLRITALAPLLFGKRIIVESVVGESPEIEVFKYQEGPKAKVSLPEEMAKVYQSLEKVLNVLELEYIHIDSAKFIIYDRTQLNADPLVLSKINLTVEKVNNEKGVGDNRFLFADRILLEIFDQDILSPDGFNRLKFKRLRISTGNRSIKVDSCYFFRKPSNSFSGEYEGFIDTVRISNLDFNLLVNQGALKIDSALCINPSVRLMLPMQNDNKSRSTGNISDALMNKDSLDFMLKSVLGNLDIGYLAVRNAKVNVVTRNGNQSTIFNLNKSNFTLEKFLVNKDPKIPIQLKRFNLQLNDYKSYSQDSMYVVGFDAVNVLNSKISLINFRIGPTSFNHKDFNKEIQMAAFEFADINWPVLLYESRIVAGNVTFIQPELNFNLQYSNNGADKKSKSNPFEVLHYFKKKIQIGSILIDDGFMNVNVSNGTHFTVKHLNAKIGVNQLLQSSNVVQTLDAIDDLSFNSGEFKNPSLQVSMKGGSYSKFSCLLKINQITQEKSDKSLKIKLNNVALKSLDFSSINNISISELIWGKAELILNSIDSQRNKTNVVKQETDQKLTIGKLSGGTTNISYHQNNLDVSTTVNQIATNQIVFQDGKKPSISGLRLDGHSFNLKQIHLSGNMRGFVIQDKAKSTLNNVEIRLPSKGEIVTVSVPELVFSGNIEKSISENLTADYIELHNPKISFQQQVGISDSIPEKSVGRLPILNINRLLITRPELVNLPASLDGKMKIDAGKSNWNFHGIHSDTTSLRVDSVRFLLTKVGFSNEKIEMIPTGNESIQMSASNILFQPGIKKWSFNLDAIKLAGFHLNMLQFDTVKQTITVNTLNLKNLNLQSAYAGNISELIKNNEHFRLADGNIIIANDKTRIGIYNLVVDKSTNSLAVDSFAFSPLVDRDTYMKDRQFRKSYLKLYSGSVKANGIDFNMLVNDKIINSKKITVNYFRYLNYIDKRLPMQPDIDKPRLTELIKLIKPKIIIDSLLIRNSQIVSDEINDKTLQEGNVTFTKIKGAITGIRNCQILPTDSLMFNIYAKLLDTCEIRVNYKQSYIDSLSSFHLKAIVNSFDLRTMNPILQPFASAHVRSGYLDTIRMSVIGRKYIAFGIMKMYYHDLNVEYLNKGVEENPTIKTKLISFFANRIVHKNNRYGTGEVYAERDQQKSFVNFWVKIFIGGVLTNTGVRTDRKQEKKYNRSIEKHNVPPIPNIPVDY